MPERVLIDPGRFLAPPEWLDADAAAVWIRIVETPGTRVTAADVDTLAVLCTAIVHHRRAAALVNDLGPLVRRAGGNTRGATSTSTGVAKNPAAQLVRDNASIIAAFAPMFGLTPSSRRALTEDDDDANDDSWLTIVPTA